MRVITNGQWDPIFDFKFDKGWACVPNETWEAHKFELILTAQILEDSYEIA